MENNSYLNDIAFTAVNIEGIRKGYLFREKSYITEVGKGKGLDLGVQPPSVKLC